MVVQSLCSCTLLGRCTLQYAGKCIYFSPKHVALIARLATSRTRSCSRAVLARELWPASDDSDGRHSLSQAIYRLRSLTHASLIEADSEVVTLGAITTDIEAFCSHHGLGRWKEAAEVYGGSLLETVELDECVDISHWVESTAAHYRLMAEDVLDGLCADGEWAPALKLSDTLLEKDNEDPRLHALRLRAIGELNGEEAAAAAFRAADLSDRGAVYELWRNLSGMAGDTRRSSPIFVGRNTELAQLERELSCVKSEGTRAVLLDGDAGIGKTALLNRFVKTRVIRGDIALVASSSEAEQKVPFGVLDQWLQAIPDRLLARHYDAPWWPVLCGLFPSLSAKHEAQLVDPVEHRRLLEALRRLFAALADNNVLLISVDDAHFADSASLAFLSYLIGKEREAPIMLLLARRSRASGGLESLVDRYSATRIALDPLSEADIDLWLRKVRIGDEGRRNDSVSSLVLRTGGSPLLIAALLEGQRDLPPEHLPATVMEYYRPILLSLSPTSNSILVAISIIGEHVARDILASIVGLSGTATASACTELLQAGLIVIGPEGVVGLRHGIVGEVALSLATEPEQRRIHGRTARLYEHRRPAGTAIAAVSHDIAGNKTAAFTAAKRAAQACAVLNAHSERLFFLKLAIANAPNSDEAAGQRVALAEVLLTLGRPGEALESLNEKLVQGAALQTNVRVQVQRLSARLALAGTAEEVEQCWFQAQSLARATSTPMVARLYSDIAGAAHDLGNDTLAGQILDKTRNIVEDLPASIARSELLLRPIRLTGVTDDCDRAFRELEALPPANATAIEYKCKLHATKGILLMSAGKPAAAEREFSEALFIAERHGLYDNLFMLYNNLGVCLIEQGKYIDAESQISRAGDYASFDTYPAQYSLVSDNRAVLYYETGRYQELLFIAQDGLRGGKTKGRRSLLHTYIMIGLAELSIGRLGKAREAEREARLLQSDSHPLRSDSSYIHIFAARMRVASEHPYEAVEYLEARAGDNMRTLVLSRWRLEIEAFRIRSSMGLPIPGIERLLGQLNGSGAEPLIERAQTLHRRVERSAIC